MSQSQKKVGFFVISAVLLSTVFVLGLRTNSTQPEEHESPTSMPDCRNEDQIEVFAEPKRVVWTGRPIGPMLVANMVRSSIISVYQRWRLSQ